MNPQPYNYMALFRAVCLIVFVAGLVILALNHRPQIRARLRRVRAWWRHQQGHVLPVAVLALTELAETVYHLRTPLLLLALLSLACGMAIK